MLIIGESKIFSLDNFYTQFDSTTMYLQPNTTEKEMVNDILSSADRHNVEVFTFIRSPRSTFLTEYNIYGTSGVEDYINENSNIYEKKYTSLFLGNIHFSFNDFKDIPSIKDIHDFHVIGSDEQVRQFKMDLINKYAGNHPEKGIVSHESKNNTMSIWLLIIIVILILTFYDVLLQKKEKLIRISMGERISKIIWENILLDSIVLVSLFATVLYVLSRVTNVFFMFEISLPLFFVLLFVNGLVYINMYFYNLKKVFSNVIGSQNILSLNYGLKIVTTIITIFIISGNLALVFQSYNLYKQKSFFEKHADYYYTRLEYNPKYDKNSLVESAELQSTFYKKFFEEFDATLLASTDGLLNGKGILANKNAFNYLSNKIKELNGISLNKDIYFILPKSSEISNAELIHTVEFFQGDKLNYNYKVIYYQDNVKLMSIDENSIYGSKFIRNPIIIYNNMSGEELENPKNSDLNKMTYLHEVMYKISSKEFNQFIKKHNLRNQIVTKTNALKNYNKKWTAAKRVLYMNFIFSLLILTLEFMIIGSIIKMEYEVNAIELSIKKVLGYSIIEKNRKIITMTVITTLLSIVSAVVVAVMLRSEIVNYLIIGGIIILFMELAVIFFHIRKIENTKIQKILKGGNI